MILHPFIMSDLSALLLVFFPGHSQAEELPPSMGMATS